jgi:hypothetical protein
LWSGSRSTGPEASGRAELASGFIGPEDHHGVSHGLLLLADISGYTAFLRGVAEAHAADMAAGTFVPAAYPLLTSLLDGIVERVAPPFELSKLEGDAVFAFARDDAFDLRGQSVVDCLDACYGAYRARLEEADRLMPCNCEACRVIGDLELKFVLHHGEFVVQQVAGHPELLGPDVTISHLLLKNHVHELIGSSAYALVTETAATRLEIPLDGSTPITERYEHFPPVQASVFALQ